jgi:hypothetical protein
MTHLDVPPRLTEKAWLGQVIRLAEVLGWRYYHTHRSDRSVAGFPDLVLVRRPRVIFAELKAQRTRATDAQLAWLAELRQCNQEVYLWRPEDAEKVARILR